MKAFIEMLKAQTQNYYKVVLGFILGLVLMCLALAGLAYALEGMLQ